jgi:hypothetical protein
MQIWPGVAYQSYLHREQCQPADKCYGMAVHDQGIVQAVLSHVLEAVGAEA